MYFVDTAKIFIAGGNGGNGCMSFRKEKFVPKGGPDGGNGGHGGDIVFEARENLHSLADFENDKHFHAGNGAGGMGKKKHGKRGEDRLIAVPCGTTLVDDASGRPIADLMVSGDRFVIIRGGRGGRGNAHFANSVNKTPRFSEKGEPGDKRWIRLELRLLADVGLVGFPNTGKSSLLCALSNANAKIGNYPYTTISPNLGVLHAEEHRITLADIPGLIEGAHRNKGLGISFLRHIEKTDFLAYVFDLGLPEKQIFAQWDVLRNEFKAYNPEVYEKPYIIVGNKRDLAEDQGEKIEAFCEFFAPMGQPVFLTSAKTGEGLHDFTEYLVMRCLQRERAEHVSRFYGYDGALSPEKTTQNSHAFEPVQLVFTESKGGLQRIQVLQPHLEKAVTRYDFSQDEALERFHRLLLKYNVEKTLLASGAHSGDTIVIGPVEFEFDPEFAE